MKTSLPPKCPRCKSSRIHHRLSGERYCLRCGQRWSREGIIIPSFDKRNLNEKDIPPDKEQLPLLAGG